jgi:hypothetical protein
MKILLTNYWLRYFSGSEVVTLELYEVFLNQGHDVAIFTNGVSQEMKIHLLKSGVQFFTPSSFVCGEEYDLVWVHQQTIPLAFFESNPIIGSWIFHHMSPFESLELTLNAEIENTLSECVLSNSMETALKLKSLGINDSKVFVLGNPAPDIFFDFPENQKSNSYFLFISNHPPEEILEAMKILADKGEKLVHIGMGSQWADSRRVTPHDLAGASVVISIGKSIQYCIAMKKNFFIYDHFGGDGFVRSSENFKANAFFNFSGRNSGEKKSAQEIVSELLNSDSRNPHSLKYIDSDEYKQYNLSKRVKEIIEGINFNKKSTFLEKVDSQQIQILRGTIEIIGRFIRAFLSAETGRKQVIAERNLILNSASWKLSYPFRRIIEILTK